MTDTDEGLPRVIGVRALAASAINNTVGGGIFVLPAIIAASLGPSAIFAYLICGVLIFFIILCFAETGSKIVVSGGAYSYIEKAFGPFAGFLANILYWLGYAVISDAAIANALADIIAVAFPPLNKLIYRSIFFLVLLGGLVYINYKGVKKGVMVVELSTFAKLFPLLLIIVLGFFHVHTSNFSISQLPNIKTLGEVTLVLFFAYIGSENALSNAGEIKNPHKTIPVGMLLGIIITVVLYILIQVSAQAVLGSDLTKYRDAPLSEMAMRLLGSTGVIIITLGAAISIFGTISSDVLGGPRNLFAASKNGILPSFLSAVHTRYATPYWSIIVYGILIFVFSVSGGFKILATISSAAILIIYLGVVLSTIKFRLKKETCGQDTFRMPFGYTIPIIAIITIIWLLSNLSKDEALGLFIFMAALTVLYFIIKLVKKK
ncbi:MAG: APC family permease [Bacteroidales bacterium]